jgi:excisionase family DNA binding protein
MSEDELMTVEEVATFLRIEETTVRRLAARGALPGAVKIGFQWRFNRAQVLAFANPTKESQPEK